MVERILQSAADPEAGTTGASAASAGVVSASAAGQRGPDSLAAFEQQARSQAALTPGPVLGNVLALAPVAAAAAGARQSMFSVPGAAAGSALASSPVASSPRGSLQSTWVTKLPPPVAFPGGAEQQQQQQQAGDELSPGSVAGRHRRLWSGAVAGPPPLDAAADGRPQAAAQQAQQAWQADEPEAAISSADDPSGELLLGRLEVAPSGIAGSPARGPSSSSNAVAAATKPPSLATVCENDALAVEASAQSRHEVAEVRRPRRGPSSCCCVL